MVASGDNPTEIDADARLAMAEAVAERAGVDSSRVRVSIVAASLLIVFDIVGLPSQDASTALATDLANQISTPEAASMLLATAAPNLTIVTTPTALPTVTTVVAPSTPPSSPPLPPPPSPPPVVPPSTSDSGGAIVAIAVSVAAVFALVGIGVVCYRRQQHKQQERQRETQRGTPLHTISSAVAKHTPDGIPAGGMTKEHV